MSNLFRTASGFALASLASSVLAHDGHGLSGTHWHATDAWGFAVAGALIGLALWLTRGDK